MRGVVLQLLERKRRERETRGQPPEEEFRVASSSTQTAAVVTHVGDLLLYLLGLLFIYLACFSLLQSILISGSLREWSFPQIRAPRSLLLAHFLTATPFFLGVLAQEFTVRLAGSTSPPDHPRSHYF